jgi:ssRNA-specific RNase YbeY (16S rRNA maturation enzyme)
VIEDMRYDYLTRFWDNFGDGGFKRLVEEGTLCRNSNYNYLLTQTAPGFATIATGCEPVVHGVVSDEWYIQLQEQKVNCIFDAKEKPVGCNQAKATYSPRNLLTTTFSDELKLFNNGRSKVIGISLNPAPAILSTGHMANAAYWFDDETGNWVTSSYYTDSLPRWVNTFNGKKFPDLYIDREWLPSLALERYRAGSFKGQSKQIGFSDENTFAKKVNSLIKKEKQYAMLKSTPWGISVTKDFAISAIVDEQLGQDEYTDYLSIAFTPTAMVTQACGPNSIELEDMYVRLDKELEHFLQFVDDQLGKNTVLIYLTSDHGTSYDPQILQQANIPAGQFNSDRAIMLLGTYLNALHDKGKWVSAYHNHQIYLNKNLIESAGLKMADFEREVADFMLQFSGVANVVTSSTLISIDFSQGVFGRMQNSFNQKRSGNVIINLEPGWIDQGDFLSSANSAYNYDVHVPLIWYGWKIKRARLNQSIDQKDIAPTIANFLDIPFPNGTTGSIIEGLQ